MSPAKSMILHRDTPYTQVEHAMQKSRPARDLMCAPQLMATGGLDTWSKVYSRFLVSPAK